MARPKKTKSPTFEDWLRNALPKKRGKLRHKIFHAWCRWWITSRNQYDPLPTEQQVQADMGEMRVKVIVHHLQSEQWAANLRDFVPIFHQENRQKKAENAAKIRWSGRKPDVPVK